MPTFLITPIENGRKVVIVVLAIEKHSAPMSYFCDTSYNNFAETDAKWSSSLLHKTEKNTGYARFVLTNKVYCVSIVHGIIIIELEKVQKLIFLLNVERNEFNNIWTIKLKCCVQMMKIIEKQNY